MYRRIRMNWLRAITGVLVLWSSTVWGASLVWDANQEPNLTGYHVYNCRKLPCTLNAGASLLVTLGKDETSLDIGTSTAIQYYFVTAYNSDSLESGSSNVVIVIPVGTPPPPPVPGGLRIESPK